MTCTLTRGNIHSTPFLIPVGTENGIYFLPLDLSGPLELTKREREVLTGVAQGERSKEIALRLGITERTVRAYLTNIYTKLNVDSRSSAVAVAVARGLLS